MTTGARSTPTSARASPAGWVSGPRSRPARGSVDDPLAAPSQVPPLGRRAWASVAGARPLIVGLSTACRLLHGCGCGIGLFGPPRPSVGDCVTLPAATLGGGRYRRAPVLPSLSPSYHTQPGDGVKYHLLALGKPIALPAMGAGRRVPRRCIAAGNGREHAVICPTAMLCVASIRPLLPRHTGDARQRGNYV